jgi:hypothetical protein
VPGELVLLQADAIDETMQWLRGYLEALAAKAAAEEIEPVEEPTLSVPPVDVAAPETVTPTEIQNGILAEAHTVAKV